MLCGCRSLPDAKLGPCEELDYDVFMKSFLFAVPDSLQYRYTLHRRGKTFIANGITHKDDKRGMHLAGFNNFGMTFYSARWQNDRFEILKNNTGMSDKFLEKSVLSDVLLLYRQLPPMGNCIRRNLLDGSLWLETDRPLAGGTGFFVVIDGQPVWGAVREGKIYFKAIAGPKDKGIPAKITVENFIEGYESEIRFFNEDFAQ
jgi:hypothetical protein